MLRYGWQWDVWSHPAGQSQGRQLSALYQKEEGWQGAVLTCCLTNRASPPSPRRSPRRWRDGRRWSAGRRRRWWRNGRTSASAAGTEGSWFLVRSQAAPKCTTPTASTWPRGPQVSAARLVSASGAGEGVGSEALLSSQLLQMREIFLSLTGLVAHGARPWFVPCCDCRHVGYWPILGAWQRAGPARVNSCWLSKAADNRVKRITRSTGGEWQLKKKNVLHVLTSHESFVKEGNRIS